MPQVKGNATFLTNLRRQTPELERRVGIDNSDAHIENEAIEERKRKELEQIHLQQHRTLVERMYELTTTKKDCCNYQRMKSIAKETRVERIMDERRKEKEEIFKRITSKDGVNSNNKTTGSGRLMVTAAGMSSIRPQTVGGAPRLAQNGFSQIRIDDSESDSDDDYYGRRYAGLKSTTALKPRTTAHPSRSRRRPKTSHPARSIRQIRQALETEFSSVPKTRQRPKTTLGFSVPDPDADPVIDGGYMPGRSFNELKDLTHIDYLNTAQIQAKEENIRRIRNQRLTNEQKVLQDKLEQFYERIEKFKRDSNRNILKATMLYEK